MFHSPRVELKKEIDELERVGTLMSTHKPGEMYRQKNPETAICGTEETTEKELVDWLSEVYMLSGDGKDSDQSATDEGNCNKNECKTRLENKCSVTTTEIAGAEDQLGQNKTEKLMQLLDKREALQAKLKYEKEKLQSTHAKGTQSLEPDTTFKNTNVTSAVTDLNYPKSTSANVFKNIRRVEEQGQSEMDSDDEVCDENKHSQESIPIVMPSCLTEVKEKHLARSPATGIATESTTQRGEKISESQQSKSDLKNTFLTFVQKILHEWKTSGTVKYLTLASRKGDRSDFDKKYEALGKTVKDRQIDEDFNETLEEGFEVRTCFNSQIYLV